MRGAPFIALIIAGCSADVGNVQVPVAAASPKPKAVSAPLVDPTLFPLARISFMQGGVESHCMGGYVGEGRVVTAAHCFADIATTACQEGGISLTWGEISQGVPLKFVGKSSCASFLAQPSGLDLAVVRLSPDARRPEKSLSFTSEVVPANSRIFIWGSPAANGNIRTAFGRIFEISGDILSHNAAAEAGFSGAPVFLWPASAAANATLGDVLAQSLETGVLGLHLGVASGVQSAISAAVVRTWLADHM